MNKNKAARLWVELNSGLNPKEFKGVDLTTHESRWAEMEKLRPLASKSEVNRLWNVRQGIENSNIPLEFGHP